MSEHRGREPEIIHELTNHLAIILGFCDLLLSSLPEGERHHADVLEVSKAAHNAIALMPELARRLQ